MKKKQIVGIKKVDFEFDFKNGTPIFNAQLSLNISIIMVTSSVIIHYMTRLLNNARI